MSTDPDQPNLSLELPLADASPRPPIQVIPLEYAPVDPNRPRVPLYCQFLAGFFFPVVYVIPAGGLAACMPGDWGLLAGWAAFIAFIPLVALIRTKTRWTAFLPGVLAMIFGLPLLAAGVCAIIAARGGFRF